MQAQRGAAPQGNLHSSRHERYRLMTSVFLLFINLGTKQSIFVPQTLSLLQSDVNPFWEISEGAASASTGGTCVGRATLNRPYPMPATPTIRPGVSTAKGTHRQPCSRIPARIC